MFKAIMGALIGVAIIMMGFFVWYAYMTSLQRGGNHFLFALAIVQVSMGTFILFWASGNSDPFKLHSKAATQPEGAVDVLAQSRKITEEWYKEEEKTSNFQTVGGPKNSK